VALDHLRLETQLERAVAQGELVLHFQPIVMLGSGDVTGVEALVRWNHPERGLLGPGAFIPVAEHTRVISALGRWVINAACREALRWPRGGGGSAVSVSVNLSVAQLRQPGLIYEVAEAPERSGLDPTNLILEVTETMLMDDVELAAETMASLKRLGVKLAVDDFGTGYCSLEYLRRFPIDILKIAKPFVDGIDGGDDRLARVILDLGRSLNLHVIAEGIERPEQAQALRGLGCRWGQGFHYARPQCARDVRQTIATARARASRLRAVEGGSVVVPRLGDLVAESAA
jgi:EAL domain-containing protein (putative c-di-GMP-specific phosphodiesterase class I)